MEGKPTAVCPSFLREMRAAFDKAVRESQVDLIVGVNPHIVEAHIWNCIDETEAEVVFCGDETAHEIWKAEHRGTKSARFVGPYVAEAVGDLIAVI